MKMFRINNIEAEFKIESGNIYNIDIEDINTYLKIINACIDNDNDYLRLYDETELKDFEKNSLFINDIFSIDSNSKKAIANLYKNISEKIVSTEDRIELEYINNMLLELLQNISNKLDVPTTFEEELDFTKILSLYKFSYEEDNSELFTKFVSYIRANYEIKNFKLIITNNILNLFNDFQIELLRKELKYMNLTMLNINFIRTFKNNNVLSITIDKDLCEY